MSWWGWLLIVIAILVVLTILTRGGIWRFMAAIADGLGEILSIIFKLD